MLKSEYIRQWDRLQRRYEATYTAKFKKALQEQVKAYIKSNDLMKVPSYPMYAVLKDLYETVGVAWANRVRLILRQDKARMPMGFNAQIVELIRQYYGVDLLNYAEQLTDVSREYIGMILSRAAAEGLSLNETVSMLVQSNEFGEMRAGRIARTETTSAANGAAIQYANTSGNVMVKEWIAVNDARTRHDHRNVDNTVIDIEAPFTVGGVQMQKPGDRNQPNGLPVPASEVVNCRCVLGFRAKRDRNGRIIRKA